MKVLIACEESQEVCKAFRLKGHEAYSCDLQDCSGGRPEWHIKGDAINEAYSGKYDLMIAHPPCTFIANSGVRWLDIVDGKITNKVRFQEMLLAARFFKDMLNAPIDKIAVENPIPHKYAGIPNYNQIIHPWYFGHEESKATCLWLKNLEKLQWSLNDNLFYKKTAVTNNGCRIHKLSAIGGPGTSKERQKYRSKTFHGIAKAMAEQWG